MAQLVEQLIRNQQVAGSSPASSSKNTQKSKDFWVFYIGIALLFKYRLRDVDALAAAVVDVRAVVGENALREADGNIHRRSLPENGGAVFREAVAVKLGVGHAALAGVEVKPTSLSINAQ